MANDIEDFRPGDVAWCIDGYRGTVHEVDRTMGVVRLRNAWANLAAGPSHLVNMGPVRTILTEPQPPAVPGYYAGIVFEETAADPLASRTSAILADMLATGGITREQAEVFARAKAEREIAEEAASAPRVVRNTYSPVAEQEYAADCQAVANRGFVSKFAADTVPVRDTERCPPPWDWDARDAEHES